MKKIIAALLILFAVACGNQNSYKKAEDAQDAGREFIRASLDGNYEKAQYYLLGDSTNRYLLERWKSSYDNLSKDEKDKYKESDIIVLDLHRENDSVTSYKYYNSYKKDTTTIKVMLVHGEWVVDMKELMKMNK